MSGFNLTERQALAQTILAGPATWLMLFGGGRSGKTFLLVRNIVLRALKSPASRHLIAGDNSVSVRADGVGHFTVE